jgi:solute carrier family 25 (adenine nucleotide translocator) protein 4/5/6/31
VKGESLSSGGKHTMYRNSWDCCVRIVREEGARGLFHGLSVNLVRSVAGAFLLVGYDECKKVFKLL